MQDTTQGSLYRLSAFTTQPEGGNPAGVWVGETLPDPQTMQQIAAKVGFSETAFVAPTKGFDRTIRYFSPEIEVPFCGHATIATGVTLGIFTGEGTYQLTTAAGLIPVTVRSTNGIYEASLTSVAPRSTTASDRLITDALAALRWSPEDLDRTLPPARAYAGAWHLILAVTRRDRLNHLDYDFDALKSLMQQEELTTLQLIWREAPTLFHARNPFPIGGIIEDPATGAAAAALGGYLRLAHLIPIPNTLTIHQGEAMGRPSRITVDIPTEGGIVVTGQAVLWE
jgi:PhzF family phenazine biosynthesis protein